jgi:type II secretory pathway pseudopilin PulG
MPISKNTTRRRSDSGYSLLMVVFMIATILILAAGATQNILVQGRREREAETVWRGEQYARAIRLYYRKFGRYPTKIDDLVKQTNGVRFLRQAYTDPMNKEDGSWRFIYVGPNGQLIGSLRQTSLLQNVLSTPSPFGLAGGGIQPPPPPGQATGQQAGASGGAAQNPNPLASQPQPLQGDVVGGNIIGVASKIKGPSLRVYMGGDTYQKWEFISKPQGIAIPGQTPATPSGPTAPPGVPLPTPSQPTPTQLAPGWLPPPI